MELKFSDGVIIETDRPISKLHLQDGWYVVGEGLRIPVADKSEADKTIVEMTVPNSKTGQHLVEDNITLTTTLFVYSTLRKGQWNHYLLASSRFLGMAKTNARYGLYGDCVPFLSRMKAVSHVTGEVYAVHSATLSRLDELEGHPDAYMREQAEVVLENGTELIAWIYFHDTPMGHLIESGEFLEKTATRREKRDV